MHKEDSISIIISTLNEAGDLEKAVATVTKAAHDSFEEYEIIIFNDGSIDGTGNIAEDLSRRNKNISVVHHLKPLGRGAIFREGKKLANMNYLMMIGGRDAYLLRSFDKIFAARNIADIVIPYATNSFHRPLLRRILSNGFSWILNITFGLKLKYYNHSVLLRKTVLDLIGLRTDSYAFQAEVLIKAIKLGYNYIEVGVEDKIKHNVKSKAFTLINVLGVFKFWLMTVYDIYFTNHYRFNRNYIYE